jgi:tetratricopeptide (TPR) repeat protein
VIRTWVRVPSVTTYDGVNPAIAKAVTQFEADLAAHPDSREAHRAVVQALSYAGDLEQAREVAARWLDRDRLDPTALGYEADLLGRAGQRDLALRTLDGLVDLDADRVALHERMVAAYEAVGRRAQACGHRIALAALQPKDVLAAGRAATCLRSLGRSNDAELVLAALPDNAARAAAEKAAMVNAPAERVTGELLAAAAWTGGGDLDISLVTPDGTRVSWMGGLPGTLVADATASDRERLALKTLKRGNYLIEMSRVAGSGTGTARGTLDVTALGERRAIPFELASGTDRVVVGRISINLEAHYEQMWQEGNFVPDVPNLR